MISPERFRSALRTWTTGVAVLTLIDGDAVRGITVSSFTSVSLEPPLVLVCIDRRARIHDVLVRAARFCANVLAASQREIADHFAGRGAGAAPRFDVTRHGTPCLAHGLGWLEVVPESAIEAGDHTIVLGRVEDAHRAAEGEPLLYREGRYCDCGFELATAVR